MSADKDNNNYSIGSILRDRGKQPDSDISDVWLSHKIDEKKNKNAEKKRKLNFNARIKKVKKQVDKTTESLKSIKLKTPKIKAQKFSLKKSKTSKGLAIVAVAIATFIFWPSSKSNEPQQLGVAEINERQNEQSLYTASNQSLVKTQEAQIEDLSVVDNTDFDLLFPKSHTSSDFTIYNATAPGATELSYLYSDQLNGEIIRINQQRLPEEFKNSVDRSIADLAKSIYATDVIAIDGISIYYGLSESSRVVQTLVFSKNNNLVFIQSPKKIDDLTWSSYISQLN